MPLDPAMAEALTAHIPLLPIVTRNGGGELLVLAACWCVDAFGSHERLLVLLVGQPGPLTPELVALPACDDAAAARWMVKEGKMPAADVQGIIERARACEKEFMGLMRARHAENYRQSQEMGGA